MKKKDLPNETVEKLKKLTHTEAFLKYTQMEGYLEKKSTGRLPSFQKRYYRVMDNGTKLCYFHSRRNPVEKPKLFMIINIVRVFPVSDREFIIEFDKFQKLMRAKNQEEKWNWVFCLNYLVKYITFDMTEMEIQKKRAIEVDGDIFDIVLMENEERVLNELGKKGKKKTMEEKGQDNLLPNEKILEIKGIAPYFQNIDRDMIDKYVIMGWMKKKKKGFSYKKYDDRWFILVSARPLVKGAEEDPRILGQHQLPIWMGLETLYYYDDLEIEDKEAKPLNEMPMDMFNDIRLKDNKDGGFAFLLDIGDKIYEFVCPYVSDRRQWVHALRNSRATYLAQKNSRNGLSKNITSIMRLMDQDGGILLLDEKVKEDYDAYLEKYAIKDFTNLDEILLLNDAVAKDLVNTMDACQANEPPRLDILKRYIPIYHMRSIELVQDYYSANEDGLKVENSDLITLINWLVKYHSQVRTFGLKDDRLIPTAEVLATIMAKRLQKINVNMLYNMLKHIRDSKPIENSNGINTTTGSQDLFKFFNETFELYNQCAHEFVARKLLMVSTRLMAFYQKNLTLILDKWQFSTEMHVGFSNDTLVYMKGVNDFLSQVIDNTHLDENEVEEVFQKQSVLQGFSKIGMKAFEKLVDSSFTDLNVRFKVEFMSLDMEKVLEEILMQVAPVVNTLHPTFASKVWKICLDKVILLTCQCMMNSANKIKIKSMEELIESLVEKRNIFRDAFRDVLGKSAIESSLKVIEELISFFESNTLMISKAVADLRKSHGPGFNVKTVEVLLKLRIDLSSDEKKSIVQTCKEMLSTFKDPVSNKPHQRDLFGNIEIENEIGDELSDNDNDEDEEKSENSEEDDEEEKEEEKQDDFGMGDMQQHNDDEEDQYIMRTYQGKLEKKSSGFGGAWQDRYFIIKGVKLYWYKDYIKNQVQKAQNFIEIKNIDDIKIREDNRFDLICKKKKYKLKAETEEERETWVQVLKQVKYDIDNEENLAKMDKPIFHRVKGGPLFKDNEPEWKEDPEKTKQLFIKEKPLTREEKLAKEKEAMKNDPNRRGSIKFDDLEIVPVDAKGKQVQPPPQQQKVEQQQPPKQEGQKKGILGGFFGGFGKKK